jgi:hypothetical protein
VAKALAAALVVGALAAGAASCGHGGSNREAHSRQRPFLVGVVDDSLAQQDPVVARERVGVARRAGFDTIVLSAGWQHGLTEPPASVLRGIRNVAAAARDLKLHLIVFVWNGFAHDAPRYAAERGQFASFAATVVRRVPGLYALIVGNEANLNTFWMPQFDAAGGDVAAVAYEDLLARTYDAVKDVDPDLRVIGGAVSPRGADRPHGKRPTHSPTAFIRDLGSAYRATGRDRPLMDAFAIHPYMKESRISPDVEHPLTNEITIADYPKLVDLLGEAFGGTAQTGRRLPVLYTEFGVQTAIPPAKLSAYEPAKQPGGDPGVSPRVQAEYYRRALELARCQPTVQGLFVFHVFDEPQLDGWQSGIYYADGTPKPNVAAFRDAAADLRGGRLGACPR